MSPPQQTDGAAHLRANRLRTVLASGARLVLYAAGMLGLLICTLLILRVPPLKGLSQLWYGTVGNSADGRLYPISATLVEAAPLLLAAISVCIAWRAGLFSIGAQGQMLIGGLCATCIAHFAGRLPSPLVTLLMVAGAVCGGAAWGLIAGWLRVKRDVQEVISTIMLNYVAVYLVSWLALGPLRARGGYLAETDSLPASIMFAKLIPPSWSDSIQTGLHSGVLLALAIAPLAHLYLFLTRSGFNLRILGSNDEAARVARLPAARLRMQAMGVSGAVAGLAGAVLLLGSATGSLPAQSFGGDTGFTAIPVALLGGLHPLGSLLSALFFGGLIQGCRNLQQSSGVSSVLIYVIQAAAVLAVVGAAALRERRAAE